MYAISTWDSEGFIGAVFRFILSTALQGSSRFPLGTLGVNTYGTEKSIVLCESTRLFLAVGILGAFTTMSTFSLETFRVLEEKQNLIFLANLALNNILCLVGIYMGKLASTLI